MKLFVDEENIALLTLQTNKYAADFIQANAQKIGEHSRFSKCPKDGIKTNKMLGFIARTYYMHIIEKDLITSYWSIDSVIATPFPEWSCLEMSLRIFLPFFIAVTIVNMQPEWTA